MQKHPQNDIERQFAENLVAQMLQRSGREFSRVHLSQPKEKIDFLVRDGAKVYAIEVKYQERSTGVKKLWSSWKQAIDNVGPFTGVGSAKVATGKKISAATTSVSRPDEQAKSNVHLVVVTGRGDKVYTDGTVAPLLAADARTDISLLGKE